MNPQTERVASNTIWWVLGAIALTTFIINHGIGKGCAGRLPSGKPSAIAIYNLVQPGMTINQVRASCGEPESTQVTETGPLTVGYITYPSTRWEYWYYHGIKVQVVFEDGVVTSKAMY